MLQLACWRQRLLLRQCWEREMIFHLSLDPNHSFSLFYLILALRSFPNPNLTSHISYYPNTPSDVMVNKITKRFRILKPRDKPIKLFHFSKKKSNFKFLTKLSWFRKNWSVCYETARQHRAVCWLVTFINLGDENKYKGKAKKKCSNKSSR